MAARINEALARIVVRMRDESGQALAEYGLIVGFIAVAAVVAVGLLATAIAGRLDVIATALS